MTSMTFTSRRCDCAEAFTCTVGRFRAVRKYSGDTALADPCTILTCVLSSSVTVKLRLMLVMPH